MPAFHALLVLCRITLWQSGEQIPTVRVRVAPGKSAGLGIKGNLRECSGPKDTVFLHLQSILLLTEYLNLSSLRCFLPRLSECAGHSLLTLFYR